MLQYVKTVTILKILRIKLSVFFLNCFIGLTNLFSLYFILLLLLLGPLPFTEICNETINGLASTFTVNCPYCGKSNTVSTSKTHRYGSRGPKAFDVNSRAALATLNAGIGHTHLSAITSALDIPQVNHVTLKAREREVGKAIENVAAKSCLEAILAEKENALHGT